MENGCFQYDTLITLEDGTQKRIKDIVDNKLKCNVLSYNFESGKIESKSIIGWYNNGLKSSENWCRVRFPNNNRIMSNKIQYNDLYCTKNHILYSSNFSEINASDSSNVKVLNKPISYEQKQVILGSMLGDGCLSYSENNKQLSLRITNSEKQKEYIYYKYKLLKSICSNIRLQKSGYGSAIYLFGTYKSKYICDFLSKYRDIKNIRKLNIKAIANELDDLGVAIWFQDDGCKDKTGIIFATDGLDLDSIKILANRLKILYNLTDENISFKKNSKDIKKGSGIEIRIKKEATKTIIRRISKYIIPSLRYKIPEDIDNIDEFTELKIQDSYNLYNLDTQIDNLNNTKYKKINNFTAYDIEVADNHNYFANNVLVHNCIAKELNSKYDYSGRRGNDWIKLKRTVSQSLLMEKVGDTIDGFVTGFKPGNVGTANEGLVGALELSVYLTDDNDEYLLDESGNPIVHHIATVSGITQELRNLISTKDENGNVALDLRFYGKVATIDGQDISSKNFRFAHATFQGWRPDRDSESCKFRKSLLERLVL